jgi:Ca2+-binding RTX toxin-like protein
MLIVGGTAAGASVAAASTVVVDGFFSVSYVAGPGEANQVTVRPVDEDTLHFVDLGATIDAGRGCQRIDLRAVQCSAETGGRFTNVALDAGDMDDTVTLSVLIGVALPVEGLVLRAEGGAGDDVLRVPEGVLDDRPQLVGVLDGGVGDDRLWGGAGNDTLDGGGGRDELYGGRGNDWLSDGDRDEAVDQTAPGPDILDGGSGGEDPWQTTVPAGDRVSYYRRTSPVSVDLRVEMPSGEEGEGDRIVDIEAVEGGKADDALHGGDGDGQLAGGPGDDVLAGGVADEHIDGDTGDDLITGDAGDDWVDGGSGDDRVRGGHGNDLLWGDGGSDRLFGDAGRDSVYGKQGHDRLLGGLDRDALSGGRDEDVLKCGPDTDDVVAPQRDLVPASCERIAFHKRSYEEYVPDVGMTVAAHPSWRPRSWLALRIACPWSQDLETGGARRRASPAGGGLKIRARRGRRALLAQASIPDEPRACAPARRLAGLRVRAPLTPLGRRLSGRADGVLATVWFRARVKVPGAHQRVQFRATWTIHLKRPQSRPTRPLAASPSS